MASTLNFNMKNYVLLNKKLYDLNENILNDNNNNTITKLGMDNDDHQVKNGGLVKSSLKINDIKITQDYYKLNDAAKTKHLYGDNITPELLPILSKFVKECNAAHGFKNLRIAAINGDTPEVANQLMLSKWAKEQNPEMARYLANKIRNIKHNNEVTASKSKK